MKIKTARILGCIILSTKTEKLNRNFHEPDISEGSS